MKGLGRQVAESGAVGRGERGCGVDREVGPEGRRDDGPRRKELYVEN